MSGGKCCQDVAARLLGCTLIKTRHFLRRDGVFTGTPRLYLYLPFVPGVGFKLLTMAPLKRGLWPTSCVPLTAASPELILDSVNTPSNGGGLFKGSGSDAAPVVR